MSEQGSVRGAVTLTLDGTTREAPANLWRVWLQPGPSDAPLIVQVDPRAKLAWRELDKLAGLKELGYEGEDEGVLEYLRARPGIGSFRWTGHGRERVDLRGTALRLAAVEQGERALELWLPEGGTVRELQVPGATDFARLRVHAAGDGAGLALRVWVAHALRDARAVQGLEGLRALTLHEVPAVDVSALAPYRALAELELSHVGAVRGLGALRQFPALEALVLRECYRLDAAEMPPAAELPALRSVTVDGVRRSDADALRAWLGTFAGKVSVRGVRTDAWLRANADNPFRAWATEYGAAAGRAATAAYRKASAAVDKLGAGARWEDAEPAMRAFVAAFNKMDAGRGIDTIMREEIADAFDELASRCLPEAEVKRAQAWFDRARDF